MSNLTWQSTRVTKEMRQAKRGHASFLIWMTGLSGAGKTTLAVELEHYLYERGLSTYLIDGDNVRHGLCRDLGFSANDRTENIRRVGEVAKLMVDAGVIVITSLISPFKADRRLVRSLFDAHEFVEVFVDCPLGECERRDPKGLYHKARQGLIKDFTGIDSPYEAPEFAELVIQTSQHETQYCVQHIVTDLVKRNLLK